METEKIVPKNLQDELLENLTKSKGRSMNVNSQDIKKVVEETMKLIENDKNEKRSTDQKIEEIIKRCEKNSKLKNSSKTMNFQSKVNVENDEEVQNALSKHQNTLKEMQNRLHHGVDVALNELGLILDDNDLSIEENEFYIEEIPQATIIRHK